jgi:hypothetical protein
MMLVHLFTSTSSLSAASLPTFLHLHGQGEDILRLRICSQNLSWTRKIQSKVEQQRQLLSAPISSPATAIHPIETFPTETGVFEATIGDWSRAAIVINQ